MTQTDYIAANRVERERMHALVERLSDEQLAQPLNSSWTVAAALGHAAFWDARVLHWLDQWESGRVQPSSAASEPDDVDWVNDATRELIHAIAPRACAELALRIAEETDRRVEQLSPAFVAVIAAAGNPISLNRAAHRREHLDEIEAKQRTGHEQTNA